MDDALFDRLTRHFSGGATRRTLLATLAALAPPGLLERTAWARKHKHKKHKKRKKKCKHPPCGGPCTVSDGNALSLISKRKFKGKSLSAAQTVQDLSESARAASQLDLTLGGAPLLSVATELAEGGVIVSVTYGNAFKGIKRARFTNDGSTITGDIDGRAINPLPADGDPNAATFADGGPPPDIQVDPDLAKAIEQLLQQAKQDAAHCAASRRAPMGSARERAPRAHPENSAACLALYIPCESAFAICLYGVGGGCAAALFGYPICVAIGVAACGYAALQCRKSIRYSETCCPVRCGGSDPLNVFGEDPQCCEKGETCLDPDSNQTICCPPGTSNCAGACCPNGRCLNNGFCCEDPSFICGNECCGGLGKCCGNQCCFGDCCGGSVCCHGVCNGGVCCNPGSFPCGTGCCDTVCCNNNTTCCPAGADCINNQCVQVCTVNEFPCKGACCSKAQYTDCCDWGCGTGACTR